MQNDITIKEHESGDGFLLTASMTVSKPIEEVFEFFSDAGNLETITPEFLNFRILSQLPIEMEVGALIDYRLRLYGIPFRWRTKISHWEPPVRFVDEQMRGPYRQWHHEHTFETVAEGTLCKDLVHYLSLIHI